MDSKKLADLDVKTITALAGMPTNKEIINPKNPLEMAKKVRVTFKPLPENYYESEVKRFREDLKSTLIENGVNVVTWDEATSEDNRYGVLSKIFKLRSVRRNIHAVVDVKKKLSPIRWCLSKFAEYIYKIVRKDERSVSEILKISGWADDFTVGYVQDPYNTQVITIMPLDPEFEDINTTYDEKITIGLRNLISNMSEIVIGVSFRNFAIINMNLSDSIYKNDQLNSFVYNSLIPKMYAPIKPPILNRFIIGEYDPEETGFAEKLAQFGRDLKNTELFPAGSKFVDKIKRQSHRDVLHKILDGRTGVSYGFIALVEEPKYIGKKNIKKPEWDGLEPVEGYDELTVRKNKKDRWFIKTVIKDKEIYQQVPDLWLVTSRSGCDKTNLNPKSDIVRIGLVKGKLHLEIPKGVDLNRRDIRPSFDTYVILCQALSTALYAPSLVKEGMPILHFHGYPDPNWFAESEHHAGANNPSLPCGTIEAALLNYSAIYETANKNGTDIKLLCLVESDHGVNILGPDKEYIIERLITGTDDGSIMLGGKYLPKLKEKAVSH
ncbi:MAG: non-ribosomal peptide synthase [Candidatus Dadabacteria bacterium]|nr:non-ribosomal peptide synthase [Candidatus Dadabacteria bacterium]NIQ15904.1 non-ribosomal peptide synthase [Candidatus Dadabacteria bacterium]